MTTITTQAEYRVVALRLATLAHRDATAFGLTEAERAERDDLETTAGVYELNHRDEADEVLAELFW